MKRILVLASLIVSLSCFAQKLTNQLSFQKGQKLEMEIKMNSTVSQGMGEAKLNGTIVREFDVMDISKGNATIEHHIKRIQINLDAPMMGTQNFDSDNPEDMKSDVGKDVQKVLNDTYTMTVDATGKVISVTGKQDTTATKSEGMNMLAGVLEQIANGLEMPKPGDETDFKILPDKPVSKGDSWTDSTASGKGSYTISNISDNEIIVDYKEQGTTQKKQEAMGMEINISSNDTTTRTITLDRKTGLLKTQTSVTNSEGKMEMMGQRIPTNNKVTKTITVKSI